MKSLRDLREEMSCVFDDLRAGRIEPSSAKELSNVAGKIINSAKIELNYSELRKEVPFIKFIEDGKEKED